MTNQEAIKRIKEHIAIHKYRESHAIHIVEALEMAISALKAQDLQPNLQPSCNQLATDCISRKAAIDAVDELLQIATHEEKHKLSMLRRVLKDALPSAQPEIIRCKDCKHYNPMYTYREYYCPKGIEGVFENDFCSRAERRTDGV